MLWPSFVISRIFHFLSMQNRLSIKQRKYNEWRADACRLQLTFRSVYVCISIVSFYLLHTQINIGIMYWADT